MKGKGCFHGYSRSVFVAVLGKEPGIALTRISASVSMLLIIGSLLLCFPPRVKADIALQVVQSKSYADTFIDWFYVTGVVRNNGTTNAGYIYVTVNAYLSRYGAQVGTVTERVPIDILRPGATGPFRVYIRYEPAESIQYYTVEVTGVAVDEEPIVDLQPLSDTYYRYTDGWLWYVSGEFQNTGNRESVRYCV